MTLQKKSEITATRLKAGGYTAAALWAKR